MGKPTLNEKGKVNKLPSGSANSIPQRAQRFPLRAPVLYRKKSEKNWTKGQIENISHSGVLFQAPEPLNLDTVLQLTFALPALIEGEGGATVFCVGRIVRTILPAASDESPSIAVKILNYELKRAE